MVVGCVLAGLVVGPFLSVLVAQVPDKRPVSWPSPVAHPPLLFWLRASPSEVAASVVSARRPTDDAGDDDVGADDEGADDEGAHDEGADDSDDEAEGAQLSARAVGLTVEVLTPALFALAGIRWGASWVVVPFLVLFSALLVVSVIDIERYRIPDRVVFPALALSLPLIVVVSFVEGASRSISFALIGAATYFILLFLAHLVYPAGMGFGDVKLALLMGLFIGWIAPDGIRAVTLVLFALMIGCVLGVVIGGGLALVRRKNAAFPFGPALAASTVIAVLFSQQLLGTS